MPVIEFIVECLFYTVCGWIGHLAVKVISLGKVDLDCGSGSESLITQYIGLAFVLIVAGSIAWLVHK